MNPADRIAVIQQFGRTWRAFMAAFEAHVGQPMPRWRIMLALYEQGGESSQKRLVEHLRVDPGALTRQLKSLESLGWIARSADARDNRITNVRLTESGRAATEAGLPRRAAFLAETMSPLSDEAIAALANALGAMEARIGALAGGGSSGGASPQKNVSITSMTRQDGSTSKT